MQTIKRTAFAGSPWRSLMKRDLGRAVDVPSMLNNEETQFYFWLAKCMAGTPGSIVDLGCFAGGSTAYLTEGALQAELEEPVRVFAYDQFRASAKVKERQLYAKGVEPFEGRDILPLSMLLLEPWSENVVHRTGRIEDATWRDGPISLLILDASKTSETMDQMAEIFFPHLLPGRSVIVQQDELHWREPWIAVQMERFKDCFEPLCHVPGGAVAYLCKKKIQPAVLKAGRVHGMDDEAMIDALARTMDRLGLLGVAHKVERQINALRLNPGQRKSWRFTKRAPVVLPVAEPKAA